MSAPNFWTMDNFPLVVMGDEEICKWYFGDLDDEGKIITEYNSDHIYSAWMEFNWDSEKGELADAIETLNDSLKWYKVELKSGYFSGVQFYIDTEWVDIKYWVDEACMYEFDLNLADTKKMIAQEEETINAFLKQMCEDFGFRELTCLGVFSNGEAIYRWTDELKKGVKGA